MIYCTLLNSAIDCMYSLEQFVPGNTCRDLVSLVFPAGKGINVASVVRAIGEEVTVIGLAPEHDERRFAAYLESREIRHRFFTIPGHARINVTIVEQKTGTATHLNSAGAELRAPVQDEFLRFAGARLSAEDIWCFAGSIPEGFDDGVYASLIKACKENGCHAFLDTRGRPLRLGVRAKPLAIKPNSIELEELFGEHIKGVHHLALKGKKLLDRGVGSVFISLGEDGMIALRESDCMVCVPPEVKTVDTVGCGDALMAGILVAWQRKFSFPETCRLAMACASSKAMHEGPHTVTREEVWQLMEDVKITAI